MNPPTPANAPHHRMLGAALVSRIPGARHSPLALERMEHGLFLLWLAYMGLLVFGALLLWQAGAWHRLIEADPRLLERYPDIAVDLTTEDRLIDIAAEGADAVARNALLPVSGLPVEAARPFIMPTLTVAQATNAQRCLTQAIYYEAATPLDAREIENWSRQDKDIVAILPVWRSKTRIGDWPVMKAARPAVQLCWPYQSVNSTPSRATRSMLGVR